MVAAAAPIHHDASWPTDLGGDPRRIEPRRRRCPRRGRVSPPRTRSRYHAPGEPTAIGPRKPGSIVAESADVAVAVADADFLRHAVAPRPGASITVSISLRPDPAWCLRPRRDPRRRSPRLCARRRRPASTSPSTSPTRRTGSTDHGARRRRVGRAMGKEQPGGSPSSRARVRHFRWSPTSLPTIFEPSSPSPTDQQTGATRTASSCSRCGSMMGSRRGSGARRSTRAGGRGPRRPRVCRHRLSRPACRGRVLALRKRDLVRDRPGRSADGRPRHRRRRSNHAGPDRLGWHADVTRTPRVQLDHRNGYESLACHQPGLRAGRLVPSWIGSLTSATADWRSSTRWQGTGRAIRSGAEAISWSPGGRLLAAVGSDLSEVDVESDRPDHGSSVEPRVGCIRHGRLECRAADLLLAGRGEDARRRQLARTETRSPRHRPPAESGYRSPSRPRGPVRRSHPGRATAAPSSSSRPPLAPPSVRSLVWQSRREHRPRLAACRRRMGATSGGSLIVSGCRSPGKGFGRARRRCHRSPTVGPYPTPLVGIGTSAVHSGSAMDDLYRDYILEHYRRPHNFGVLETPTAATRAANPLCGDRITMQLGDPRRQGRRGRLHRPRLRDQPGQREPPDRRDQGQAVDDGRGLSAPTTCSTCSGSRSARPASSARCSASTRSSTPSPSSTATRRPRRRPPRQPAAEAPA